MRVLGLDPSLTGFGWCIYDPEAVGYYRVVAKGRWSTGPKTIWVERYVQLRGEVRKLLESDPDISCVGVESPPFGEQFSEGLYALFLMVNEAIWSLRKDVVYFDPGTVKMLTKVDPKIRKGKMFKSDMVDAAKSETCSEVVRRPGPKSRGHRPTLYTLQHKWNADEADAYHIAKFASRFWLFLDEKLREEDLTPAELRAFARVHTFTRGKKEGQTLYAGAMFKEGKRFFRFSKLPATEVGLVCHMAGEATVGVHYG